MLPQTVNMILCNKNAFLIKVVSLLENPKHIHHGKTEEVNKSNQPRSVLCCVSVRPGKQDKKREVRESLACCLSPVEINPKIVYSSVHMLPHFPIFAESNPANAMSGFPTQ